jgi:glycosyltransferase involved in cell wall biosynthesis
LKKIAFIGTKGFNFGEDAFGGFETVITELAPRFVKKGYDVTVYCRKKLYKTKNFPDKIDGVNLKFLGSVETKNFGTLSNSFAAVLSAIKNKTDVVFFFNIGLGIYIPLLKLFGIKVVTNLDGIEWERSKWSKLAKLMFKTGAYFNVKMADVLIADAEAIRQIYKKKFNRDSIVISYGAELIDNIPFSLLEKYDIKENNYYLLATRFIPENYPKFIIEEFVKTKTDKELVVLGKNYYGSEYENSIKNINDPRVKFLGHIANRKELLAFYRYSYCYMHGHSMGGTNPTMLEAMANSSAILALDTVFNREMLDNENFGLYFNLNDQSLIEKISFMDENPELAAEMKSKTTERIKHYYNWDLMEKKYYKMLESLKL